MEAEEMEDQSGNTRVKESIYSIQVRLFVISFEFMTAFHLGDYHWMIGPDPKNDNGGLASINKGFVQLPTSAQ